MKNIIKNKRETEAKAFTIVELLIVIVIIGILAAITIVSYTGITKKANEASLQSDLANSKKKFALYFTEHGVYPTGLDENKCPTGTTNPSPDTNYCLKVTNNTTITLSEADGTKYKLTATKAGLSYEVTDDTSPTLAGTTPTEPILPESDWITIGTQRWARANLNVGTMIPGANNQTNNSTPEKYCYNDTESNCTTYGALYQWDEAMQYVTTEGAQGLCPTGSHIPTDAEWKTLEMHLGMTQATADTTSWRGTDQGTQLKPGGSSGLNMPLAGDRATGGTFVTLSSDAHLWSSSESSTSAWNRHLNASQAGVRRHTYAKAYGFSVRCVGN